MMNPLTAIGRLFAARPAPDPEVRRALARVLEIVDPLLAAAPGLEDKLAAPLAHALGYCAGLVDALPGPIDISRQAFGSDPLVHTLFATADDIGHMLGASQAVHDHLADSACLASDHFYALLAARRHEKHQLGMALAGEVIHAEVPQTVVYFADHALVEPHCELAATRERLRDAALASLLKSFHAHVEALRLEKESLAADAAAARAHMGVPHGHEQCGGPALATRRFAELDSHLRSLAESLMPEQLEAALAAFLQQPEMSLHLCDVTLRVDRLGVIAKPDSTDAVSISFPELCGRDRRRHFVMLARIDREEARQALESALERQRRFLFI